MKKAHLMVSVVSVTSSMGRFTGLLRQKHMKCMARSETNGRVCVGSLVPWAIPPATWNQQKTELAVHSTSREVLFSGVQKQGFMRYMGRFGQNGSGWGGKAVSSATLPQAK